MIKIKVPATSANLGSGFDVLGLAVDRFNIFTFDVSSGTENERTLVHEAYHKVFSHLKMEPRPVEITIETNIPMARGLGSSASCIVGGVMGANEVLGNPLSKKELLKLATEIEGHPDNIAPALYGGMVVSVVKDDEIYSSSIPVKNDYHYLVLVPDFNLSTKEARGALPQMIAYGDGVFNVSRVSLLITALITGQDELIKVGLEDKLHQPYRGELIPGFKEILESLNQIGVLGCYLSGAGPSMMCLIKKGDIGLFEQIKDLLEKKFPEWTIFEQKLEQSGAVRIE